jgi:hypothetical protein
MESKVLASGLCPLVRAGICSMILHPKVSAVVTAGGLHVKAP